MIIGICGKSGSGKSSLAKTIINTNENAIHLDIDKVGHEVLLLPEAQKEIINYFGKSIIENNIVNRNKLSKIVFTSREEMEKLNIITWKYMQKIIDEFIEQNKGKIIILDWLLLPKTKYFDMCDIKILLDIPYEVRKERTLIRDNIKDEDFDLRDQASINYQIEDFDYVFKSNQDELIKRMVKSL